MRRPVEFQKTLIPESFTKDFGIILVIENKPLKNIFQHRGMEC